MVNMKTIKIKRHAGIDDLEGMMGDMATEWWTELQWAEYNAVAPNREKRNADRIAKLKEDDEFGKEYEISCSFIPHPLFDEPETNSPIMTSSRMIIFDMSKQDKDEL